MPFTFQHKISSVEESYPEPTPPTENKPADTWYDDDDFNKASDDADLLETEAAVDEVPAEVGGNKHRPAQPSKVRKPKIDFMDVDEHARNVSLWAYQKQTI